MSNKRQGGLGAMMDEYERASAELIEVLQRVDTRRYEQPIDGGDEHTASIKAIMQHVVSAGYGYATYLRKLWGKPGERPVVPEMERDESIAALRTMLAYTVETLSDKWTLTEDETDSATFTVNWGVQYNIEQMMEHAIVHILRHRRQVERLLA